MMKLRKTLLAVLALSLCACSKPSPEATATPETTPEATTAPTPESTTSAEPTEVTLEDLQSAYAKAKGYQYMAIGYYASDVDNGGVRDGYVPYDENFTQKETNALESYAHGVSIRLTMVPATSGSGALEVLMPDYAARNEAKGLTYMDGGEVTTADNDTIAFVMSLYVSQAGEIVYTILYADVRDDGNVYMCAEIELYLDKFDDDTKALVAEVDSIYALTISNLELMNQE